MITGLELPVAKAVAGKAATESGSIIGAAWHFCKDRTIDGYIERAELNLETANNFMTPHLGTGDVSDKVADQFELINESVLDQLHSVQVMTWGPYKFSRCQDLYKASVVLVQLAKATSQEALGARRRRLQHAQPECSPIRQPEAHAADYGSIECFREGPIAWRLNFGPDMTLDDKRRVIEGLQSSMLSPPNGLLSVPTAITA